MNDKIKHFLSGIAAVGVSYAVIWVSQHYGLGPAVALGVAAVGWGYELAQQVSKTGDPNWKDAMATTSAGLLFWLGWWLSCN